MRRAIMVFAILAYVLQGCIGIPVTAPEATPFSKFVSQEFVTGQTTLGQMRDLLGAPTLTDGTRRIYRDSRDGWTWLICAAVILNAGCTTTDRTSKDFFLVADFDDSNLLSAIEILDTKALCEDYRICYHDDLLMRAADERDVSAGRFGSPGGACTAYVYSEKEAAGRLEVDGRRVGYIVGNGGYHRRTLAAGRHLLTVFSDVGTPYEQPAAASINCSAGETFYFRYIPRLFGDALGLVDAATAQSDLRGRWLARTDVDDSQMETLWIADKDVFVVRNDAYHVRAFRNAGPGKLTRWGVSEQGERCGSHAALATIGLWPAGGPTSFRFSDGTRVLEFNAVCTANGQCGFRSLFDDKPCRVWQDEKIIYSRGAWLLVIEPDGDSYRQLYFGESARFDAAADCDRDTCTLAIEVLRGPV